jgi:hypothetical protein
MQIASNGEATKEKEKEKSAWESYREKVCIVDPTEMKVILNKTINFMEIDYTMKDGMRRDGINNGYQL